MFPCFPISFLEKKFFPESKENKEYFLEVLIDKKSKNNSFRVFFGILNSRRERENKHSTS